LAELREKIAVIGNAPTVTGFRLAGIDSFFIADGAAAEEKLATLLSDTNYGVLVVSERVVEGADWRLKKRIEATAKPVVVAIPDMSGGIEQTESLAFLIKRALGFDLMKKS
jgi:vacuolar-type H+-ATPase subunit F/Vma7